MKLGLFSVVDHYPNELARTSQQFYEELLEQIRTADRLDFDSYWIAEHHFHEYGGVPRTAILLAAAAQQTKRIRLGTAVVVLPFDNPLRTAEDFAMVDVLSGGRLSLGVGSGYLKHEYAGFGIDSAEKRERFEEALEVLLEAWKGKRFSYEGKYHKVSDVQLNVLPLQKPLPPIAIAILGNDRAAVVGAQGFPIMMIPYATTEDLGELAQATRAFRDGFARAGRRPEDAIATAALHVHCAESTAEARRQAQGAMERYVRTRLYAKQRPFEHLVAKELVAVGDPEEVIRVIRLYEAAGFTHFLGIHNFGGLEHRHVMESLDLMARHVLPAVDRQGESRQAKSA